MAKNNECSDREYCFVRNKLILISCYKSINGQYDEINVEQHIPRGC